MVNHGTDEGGELEVSFGVACLRVDGGLRVRVSRRGTSSDG